MAQICPACKTSNDDGATKCRQCGAALPGGAAKTTGGDGATSGKTTYRPAGTTPGTPAGATSGPPAGASPAARRAASSGAIAEAARRAAAQQKAAQTPTAAPATRAGTPGTRGEARTTPATRSPVRGPSRGIAAPINNALDRAGLPRFSTQRYLVIWAVFAVILVAVIIALVAIGASNARQVVPTPQPGAVLTGTVATVETSQGVFKLKLNTDDPSMKATIENFRVKAASGFYDGKIFHRVEDWVVQTGDPHCSPTGGTGCGSGGGSMSGEYNTRPFVRGSVGMAAPSSHAALVNDSQWFVLKADRSQLNNNYPNFGEVTEGMDVVDKLVGCSAKAGGTAGELDCSKADKIVKLTLDTK